MLTVGTRVDTPGGPGVIRGAWRDSGLRRNGPRQLTGWIVELDAGGRRVVALHDVRVEGR